MIKGTARKVKKDGIPRNPETSFNGVKRLLQDAGELEELSDKLDKDREIEVTLLQGYKSGTVRYLLRQDGENLTYSPLPDRYLNGE